MTNAFTYAVRWVTASGRNQARWHVNALEAEHAYRQLINSSPMTVGYVSLAVTKVFRDNPRKAIDHVEACLELDKWARWTVVAAGRARGWKPLPDEEPNLWAVITGNIIGFHATEEQAQRDAAQWPDSIIRAGYTPIPWRSGATQQDVLMDMLTVRYESDLWRDYRTVEKQPVPVEERDLPSLQDVTVAELLRALADRFTDWDRRGTA